MKTKYLKRIGIKDTKEVGISRLRRLHQHHLSHVPFENLDIQNQIPISLETEDLFNKIVHNHRGGFCYELNYLFHQLLNALGYSTKVIAARIYNDQGELGPEFDHMAIVAELEDNWLLDVGFGDLITQPVMIKDGNEVKDWFKSYKIERIDDNEYLLSESENHTNFTKKYQFDIRERSIDEFKDQCFQKHNSDQSYFVKNLICTRTIPNGRKTIFNQELIIRENNQKTKIDIESEDQYLNLLNSHFDVQMDRLNVTMQLDKLP